MPLPRRRLGNDAYAGIEPPRHVDRCVRRAAVDDQQLVYPEGQPRQQPFEIFGLVEVGMTRDTLGKWKLDTGEWPPITGLGA